ncbi:MAG: DUF192 domain-containing protein [Candidatus Aenigmarchaeota archaeon]|nr:DUF192 domain-containing protein [Candidatus Aenigmarchaeota archaeon]
MELKFLIPIAIVVVVLILMNKPTKYSKVTIGDVEIKTEIADTPLKQMKGLMFRKHLPENEGMLFVFGGEDYRGIWMMNTSIPLDIIWINGNMEIVHIEKNVQPCGIFCPVYQPDKKAKYVLEVNAGFVEKNDIDVDHFVEIHPKELNTQI